MIARYLLALGLGAMLAHPLRLAAQQPVVRGRIVDAATRAPLAHALVQAMGARALSDDSGRFQLPARAGDTLRVRRIGYRPLVAVASTAELYLALEPAAFRLARVVTRDSSRPGRVVAARSVDALRAGGVLSTGEAMARLPYVTARASRGTLALSMRGARPEQTLVLLDGVPLNDPATGSADVSDIPLAALGGISAAPGSAGATYGSGAAGGVIDLTTARGTAATLAAGAYGRRLASLAGGVGLGEISLHGGAELSLARNDYPFLNDAGARDSVEIRRNEDEHRLALFGSAITPTAQLTLLGTRTERGLAGPMNVRVFDAARGETRRGFAHLALSPGGWHASISGRALDAVFRNPGTPDSRTTSLSGDAELRRRAGAVELAGGAGVDRVTGTALPDSIRPRGFASASGAAERGAWRATLSARADVVRGSGVHLSPALALERSGAVSLFGRVGQGFRAPTFYDLYFSSPQWVDPARSLRPERVVLDAELGARAAHGPLSLSGSIFARRTRDAIVWFPGTFSWSPANVPLERVLGGEGRLRLTMRRLDLDLWAGARSARIRSGDGALVSTPYVAPLDGGALAHWRIGDCALTAAVSALGSRPTAAVPDLPRFLELPAVLLADAALEWQHPLGWQPASLVIGARNVADTRWQSVARYPAAGRTWTASLTIHP